MKSTEELIKWLMNGLQPGLKMTDLEDKGIFSEEVTETEDLKTITRTFTSYDDSMTKIITLYIPKQSKEDVINELDKQIKEAVKQENYLLAAELQKQKQEYLQS